MRAYDTIKAAGNTRVGYVRGDEMSPFHILVPIGFTMALRAPQRLQRNSNTYNEVRFLPSDGAERIRENAIKFLATVHALNKHIHLIVSEVWKW